MNSSIQFQNVMVVAESDNVFTRQLDSRGISYQLCDERTARMASSAPDLIIVINLGREKVAVPLKRKYPDAQVMICRGGAKNVAPYCIVEFGHDVYDYHYFSSWGEFIVLIGQRLAPLPQIFSSTSTNEYRVMQEVGVGPDNRQRLSNLYHNMVDISAAYLQWYLAWLNVVQAVSWDCDFNLPKKRRLVKRLTIPVRKDFTYLGIPIFHEEDRLTFYDDGGEVHRAVVKALTEDEMTIQFEQTLSRQTVNRLVSFNKETQTSVAEDHLQCCQRLHQPNQSLPQPFQVVSGQNLNEGHRAFPYVWLTESLARKLFHDFSQGEALTDIVSQRPLSIIQGGAGTGKTFLSALATLQFFRRGQVCLLISHSNQGLDNLLSVVAPMGGADTVLYRLGNNRANVTAAGLPFHRSVVFDQGDDAEKDNDDHLSEQEAGEILERLSAGENIIIACTMNSFHIDRTMKRLRARAITFDAALIDECSRGFFFELLPIVEAVQSKLILVGDPDQLGNIDLSPEAKRHLQGLGYQDEQIEEFVEGWFNTVIDYALIPSSILRINRRSLPVVCKLVSRLFYGGQLISGRFEPDSPGRVTFLDTVRARDRWDQRHGTSYFNEREANLAVNYAVNCCLANGVLPEELGIITSYRPQKLLIRRKLRQRLFCDDRLADFRKQIGLETMDEEDIQQLLQSMVNTVDAFQGSQRRVIIVSFVRSNREWDIGFNVNIRRLRVAFSRAADELVIVADSGTFLKCQLPDTAETIRVRDIFRSTLEYIEADENCQRYNAR